MTGTLERWFGLSERGSDVRTEVTAGVTTFLTMVYIAFVNPSILSEAGMPFGPVFVATCLATAFATLVMGLYANYPIALAPGMGLNAFFTYGVVLGMGYPWEVALGAVFVSGTLFVTLSVLPVRRWIIDAIPRGQKMAISAGIGIFLGVIALRSAGIIEGSPDTLLTVGELTAAPAVLALLGFCAIAALSARRVPGAAILGMLGVTAMGLILGVSEWHGFASLPPDPTPTLLALDIGAALQMGMIAVIFTFLIVDLFDTAGTLIGVAHQADLLDDDGRLPRIERALMADSTGTVAGTLLGTSSVTSYIESAAGVSAGGRTGLTAVVVAGLFLACLFLSPLAESVPPFATAAAILYVACLMTRALKDVEWDDITESAAAVVTAIAIPLTHSIADGIGLGFITYVAIKVLAGRWRECPPMLLVVALVFAAKFIWL
ncbi:MAG: NCS2 family permease [Gemmatimonadota bacterium]|uniref:NCS2 family permease n=1 Tax=Candidatus Palauibacter scopulicola TaxID=3056741 RepID=UPI002382657E|nr:NCS2 family permease [Candidatus Palauibacter scopulicola]MDE2662019.1 NCS2 family permease [Candidatus Palauibacter scopulicola]